MAILAQAPLIEAIFEIRWGNLVREPSSVRVGFSPEETDFFPGEFKRISDGRGFGFVERINSEAPRLPHLPTFRFRRAANQWPCFQIGLGLFTVNQVNEGYDWGPFKTSILEGLSILDGSYPGGLSSLPVFGVGLRYQDAFILEGGETSGDFLNKKLNMNFVLADEFLGGEAICGAVEGEKFSFSIRTDQPSGSILVNLQHGMINDRPGFVMDTTVLSSDDEVPVMNLEILSGWLDSAHGLQRHTFDTLINKTYRKSFK